MSPVQESAKLLRPPLIVSDLAFVSLVKARADCPAVSQRLEMERGSDPVDFSVARSLLEIYRCSSGCVYPARIGLVIVDLATAAAVAGLSDLAGLAATTVVAVAADSVGFVAVVAAVCLVCSSAAAMGKGKAFALAASYFLAHRFCFLRNRNSPSLPCFAVRT